jgi:hypothetical protein
MALLLPGGVENALAVLTYYQVRSACSVIFALPVTKIAYFQTQFISEFSGVGA